MAQDVALWGVAYTDVPEVRVPKQGGGMAAFHDVSDTTASAADVAQGKLFHTADGTLTEGTASGGGGDDGSFKAVIERSGNVTSLPADLTNIGNYAFHSCTDLAITSLPLGVTSIGLYAFFNCGKLALTSLPPNLVTVRDSAFYQCSKMPLTSFPSSITSIGSSAFESCHYITATELPPNITIIPSRAFYQCIRLAITSLPSGLTQIGQEAFRRNDQITIDTIPSNVATIGSNAFRGCQKITSISSSAAITTMSTGAFSADSVANRSSNLTEAHFPNMSVSSLSYVFGNTTASDACQKLHTVDVGQTRAIAANAFANCYQLQTLVLRRSGSICTLSNVSAFLNTPMRGYNSQTGTIYVPQALIETYKTASNWSTIYNAGYLTFAAIEGSPYELS